MPTAAAFAILSCLTLLACYAGVMPEMTVPSGLVAGAAGTSGTIGGGCKVEVSAKVVPALSTYSMAAGSMWRASTLATVRASSAAEKRLNFMARWL